MRTLSKARLWQLANPERYRELKRKSDRAYYQRKRMDPEWVAKQREKSKKYYPKARAKFLALPEAERKRRQNETWRKWYYKKRREKPEEMRAHWRKRYWQNPEYNREQIKKSYRKHWLKRKLTRELGAERLQVNLICERCHKAKTLHPSGVCQPCRKTLCKKCGKILIAQYLGQRLHTRCTPKD